MAVPGADAALEPHHRQDGAHRIAALVGLFHARARPGLRLGIDGENAVADRKALRHRKIHERAGGFLRDDFEMNGVAANDAAERHRAVIGLAPPFGGLDRDGDRCGNFQRARHRDAVPLHSRFIKRSLRAGQERIGDVIIETRFDHEDTRIREVALLFARGAPRFGHGRKLLRSRRQ
jgi:hypothetical protein